MFAKSIVDSDAFLEMPMSARLLYYDLSMRADDDGFVNSPRKIMKFVGATNDDMNILIARKFVIAFDNGVVVIKHWRIHNYIQSDRYKETNYKEQKALLTLDENKAYKMALNAPCIQNVSSLETQVRLDKVSIEEVNKEIEELNDKTGLNKVIENIVEGTQRKRFVKPTLEEVRDYCTEKHYNVNPEHFIDYYESNGWKVGRNSMKDWKAAVRNWARRDKENQPKGYNSDYEREPDQKKERSYSQDEFERLLGISEE